MERVYTLREFRARTKEAFDLAKLSSVQVKRGKEIYILMYSSDEGQYPNRPEDLLAVIDDPKDWVKPCKHGANPKFCRHAKNGKPCK